MSYKSKTMGLKTAIFMIMILLVTMTTPIALAWFKREENSYLSSMPSIEWPKYISNSIVDRHLLVQPEDVAHFGNVIVTSPDHLLKKGSPLIQGWEEARSIGIAVISPKPGEYAAQIVSSSYKFSSPEQARVALASIPDPRRGGFWKDGASLLDNELSELMNVRSGVWLVEYAIDENGLPVYGFITQNGSYVSDVYIVVLSTTIADELTGDLSGSGREYVEIITRKIKTGVTFKQLVDIQRARAFGQRLLVHIIKRLMTKDSVSLRHTYDVSSRKGLLWWTSARASHWVHQSASGAPCGAWDPSGNCHHLAVWGYPHGHNQHYQGLGGDALTCKLGGEHGCISNWTWWLQVPESRLGIPKTFYFGAAWSGSMNAHNYSATVWVD